MLSQIFIESRSTWNPKFIRVRRVLWYVHTGQYIGLLRQILFFSYFHRISLNKYLFFPYFHLVLMLLTNFNLLTSWCFYRGRGGGDGYLVSNFCWKIPYHIQNLCLHGQGGRDQPNVDSCGDREGVGVKNTETVRTSFMDGFSLWKLFLC